MFVPILTLLTLCLLFSLAKVSPKVLLRDPSLLPGNLNGLWILKQFDFYSSHYFKKSRIDTFHFTLVFKSVYL